MPDVLLVDNTNFEDYPKGGLLTFSKQMVCAFGDRLALVGISTDNTPVGMWTRKTFEGVSLDYFSFARVRPTDRKPLIPLRVSSYLALRRYRHRVSGRGIRCAFVQTPESMLALRDLEWRSLCYIFHGVANPLQAPRYGWARPLSGVFESRHFAALNRADLILACADQGAIDGLVARSHGRLAGRQIVQFPTRVDTDLFCPGNQRSARRALLLSEADSPLLVSCGRINRIKGWDLVLDSFALLHRAYPSSRLCFVGDGEDRPALEERVRRLGLGHCVTATGFESPERVALYLNASDLCLVGSREEGWSIAMLEALACGKRIVTTDVSGAREMVREGKNGFVVSDRDPRCFADAISAALSLEGYEAVSRAIAERHAVKNLVCDLAALWEPLA